MNNPLQQRSLPRLLAASGVIIISQIFFLICVSAPSCQENLREKALKHKVRTVQYWGSEWSKKPLSERLAQAPGDLIEKLLLDNQLDGFTEIPRPAAPPKEFVLALKQVTDRLPPSVAALAQNRIIGVFTVGNLGGSGYAESVMDENGVEKYAIIILDRDVLLKRKANAWATWKERSIFKPVLGKSIELNVTIESTTNDTAQNAVAYILLHEIGHALGMASGAHASWTTREFMPDRFSMLSWHKNDNEINSNFDDVFPQRKFIKPYAFDDSSLPEDQIAEIYRILNTKTNFTTIHAAVDLWEDFAESFVSYVHVIIEKKPYEVRIRQEGAPETVYQSCWNNTRCRDKRVFMDQWFAEPLANSPAPSR